MIYLHGVQVRRIELLWRESRQDAAHYLVETWDRKVCTVLAHDLGADEGINEILSTAKLRSGQILARPAECEK